MRNGYTPSTSNSKYWLDGTIPWFKMEDIRQNGNILSDSISHVTIDAIKSDLFPANTIIIATSATIGEHALIKNTDYVCNQRFTCLIPTDDYLNKLNMKYMYYYCFLLDEWCKKNTNISGFASVDMLRFKGFIFPIPTLKKQEHIVSILDKFDALVNDLTTGLPAEIAARHRQYEYYRNKLLTFPEVRQ